MVYLYDKLGKTNLGALDDVISCFVTEERNGMFELELEYPNGYPLSDQLQTENIIICDANDTLKSQKFRIYDTQKLMDNTIVVLARHISFDLMYDYIDSVSIENQSCEYALNQLFRKSNFSTHYKGYSDIINAQDYSISMSNILEVIGGKSGSIIDTFGTGAEILRDNENIHVLNKRGYDNGITIEYSKNLTGFELEEDTTELITRILPYAKYTNNETNEEITVKADYVDSPLIGNYSHPFISAIDYSEKFKDGEEVTTSKLIKFAQDEFKINKVDIPKQNFKIDFIPLSKCVGYEGIEDRISLCDTVTIKDSRYNVNTQSKVIKTVFNVLKNRYESMELGDPKTSLADIVGNGGNEAIVGPPGPQGPPGADGSIGDFPNSLPSTPVVTTKVYGFSNIEISWTFENKVYYQYEVYASKDANFTPNAFNLIHQGQTSSFMYQAKPNETWYFKVCALNSHGNRTAFGSAYATTSKIDDLSNYVSNMAIDDALIGTLRLDRGWVGTLRGNYIDAKQLSVTDGNGKRTLDIDSFGNVNLDVTSLRIQSEDVVTSSQLEQSNDKIEMKFAQSGGFNLLYNGDFTREGACWTFGNNGEGLIFQQYGLGCPNGKGIKMNGTIGGYVQINQYLYDLHLGETPLTISYYTYVSSSGADGTTNLYRTCEVEITYEDDTQSWHKVPDATKFDVWERKTLTIQPSKPVKNVSVGLYARDTSKTVYYSSVVLETGTVSHEWTPNPNEAYGGVTTIDKDGITVKSTNSSTYTEIDSDSFRVNDDNGGTVAEFAQTSTIPVLNSGAINAQEVYADNLVTKSKVERTYSVNGSTGIDSLTSTVFRTVQYVLDNFVEDVLDANVRIDISNSVQGWSCTSRSGKGEILFYLDDTCIVSSMIHLKGCSNSVRVAGNSTNRKATLKEGITINSCPNFDVGWLTFRGKNLSSSKGSCCVFVTYGSRGLIRVNDFNGVDYGILVDNNSEIWCYNNKGSNVSNYIGISAYTIINMRAKGSDVCPDYTQDMYSDAGHANLYYIRDGATFTKTPSVGWSPAYTPTQKTQVWSFNKIWSDETLHGWSDRQELIQGYSSTWNTGRWTGYLQMTDGMSGIRNVISGGTNLSGRIYVQRTSSSGNSTGSRLCLYASDGTLITNSTTINRGQGVWVSLSSSIISKIQSGSVTYFYLKADGNNTSTYFKCQSNAKIEITYTK